MAFRFKYKNLLENTKKNFFWIIKYFFVNSWDSNPLFSTICFITKIPMILCCNHQYKIINSITSKISQPDPIKIPRSHSKHEKRIFSRQTYFPFSHKRFSRYNKDVSDFYRLKYFFNTKSCTKWWLNNQHDEERKRIDPIIIFCKSAVSSLCR